MQLKAGVKMCTLLDKEIRLVDQDVNGRKILT
jgi:hypothetical protein